MEAYCVKCKEKREMTQAQAVFTKTGTPATSGICAVCGTKLFRMGRTDAHEGLIPPPKIKREKKKIKRSGKLVVVESPAKAKTIGKYLGKGYTVKASVGHVRDLLRSQISVDVENDFTPKYRVPNDKRPVVKDIKALAQKAEEIYLATDPDREGEAIAWHLMESAEMDPALTKRVVFNEITKGAVQDAFTRPREIDMDLVDAQQARRVLDRLVGYNLSPILWRKVRGRLSAGRVQSVALRMIVEREREVDAFVPVEYWSIEAELQPDGKQKTFVAKLVRINKEEVELGSEGDVKPILVDMETAGYAVSKVKRGTRKRRPSAPFITSTMQQEASRRFSFTARRTMAIAQQLYEGIDFGEGESTGLITYMRTDSTHISTTAQGEVRDFIQGKYGDAYLPKEPPKYTKKARGAQEAHEAVRPTSVLREPKGIKAHLSRDQYRLYNLIWQRFVASQMSNAIYDTLSIEITGKSSENEYLLRASGSTIQFAGFLVVYEVAKDEDEKNGNGNGQNIPNDLEVDQAQKLVRLIPEQHFTQPPPRFSEATLVRALEENGIGRPSTYAPTLGTLQTRGYVIRENKKLLPTETGMVVNDLLIQYFPNILDTGFTARMEEQLDEVANGKQAWVAPIRAFYGDFEKQVEHALAEMPEVKAEPEKIGRDCPECGNDLIIRWGRYGKFIGCSNFPDCRFTEPWLQKINVICPLDGGDLVERRTRKGRTFYGCANYPECDFTSWKRPLPKPCPNCGGTLVVANKKQAQCLKCEERYDLEEVTAEEESVGEAN